MARKKTRVIDEDQIKEQGEQTPPMTEEELAEQLKNHKPEEISVYYPEQLFSPAPYNSFRVGNLWYKTFTLPGETPEDAYKRAWKYVQKLVEEQYVQVRADFWKRYNSMTV